MITPIRTMTINQIMERKDDLLVSADDIKELARQERNKAIDDLLKQVQFEEKWLFDTGTRSQDVKIAFSGIYMEAKSLKS